MLKGGYKSHPDFKSLHRVKPIISIITVNFNAAEGLEKTIQSVLSQNFEAYEHIIIDAASKDQSLEVIKKYDAQIATWISEPDKGIYEGMNKGLHLAEGEYVWFINSGDLLESNHTLMQIFSAPPEADIIYGELHLVDEKYNVLGTRSELTTRKLPRVLSVKSFKLGMVVSHQALIVRKNLNQFFRPQYRLLGDYDWAIRCVQKAKKIQAHQKVIARFLMGGASKQRQRQALKERFQLMVFYFGFNHTILAHIHIFWNNIVLLFSKR